MKHKKLKQFALLLFVIGLPTAMAQPVLHVKEKTGFVTSFDLKNVKSLTFSAGNLMVNKKEAGSDIFALSGIQNLNFSQGTGINTLHTNQSLFTIFPNPVKDVLCIGLMNNDNENHQVEIRSIDGKLIISAIFNSTENRISVSHLTRGIYFCRVQNETAWNTLKFIKQ